MKNPSHIEQEYWNQRYETSKTGWNIGYVSTPIKEYVDTIEDKFIKILIPGAGNAYEAEYLFNLGFKNVFVLDIAPIPLQNLKNRVPSFPKEQLIHENFFDHQGQYDLIIEQTFFCSFLPTKDNRTAYAQKMYELLKREGQLVGLWFNLPTRDKRPFGGTKEEYLSYFTPKLRVKTFEICSSSVAPRMGNEFWGEFSKV